MPQCDVKYVKNFSPSFHGTLRKPVFPEYMNSPMPWQLKEKLNSFSFLQNSSFTFSFSLVELCSPRLSEWLQWRQRELQSMHFFPCCRSIWRSRTNMVAAQLAGLARWHHCPQVHHVIMASFSLLFRAAVSKKYNLHQILGKSGFLLHFWCWPTSSFDTHHVCFSQTTSSLSTLWQNTTFFPIIQLFVYYESEYQLFDLL